MAERAEFNAAAFYAALDVVRAARGMHWKGVASEAGISASTMTRLAQGKRPDVDSLAALISWSGLSADDFLGRAIVVNDLTTAAEALSKITTLLSSDPRLSAANREAMIGIVSTAYLSLTRK